MSPLKLVLPLLLATLLLLGTGWVLMAAEPLEGVQPAQWRVTWKRDPATTATLSWSTAEAGSEHQVEVRAEGEDEPTTVAAEHNGQFTGDSPQLFYHHAELTDLSPATTYHVRFVSDDQRSPEFYFTTAPDEDVPFSLLFGADSRSGRDARLEMNAMLADMVDESYHADRPPIVALAHGGDYIQDGRRLDQWSEWMSDHETTVGRDGRLLPVIPARGNHDRGELYNQVFGFPEGDGNYFATDLSPQVRLLTLNTETSVTGDQTRWLEQELVKGRPQVRWLLAQYHRPAFPAVKVPWTNFKYWVPLFEKYNVDLVCEGDGHVIKRTPPLRDFGIDPTGVVYIGEGGLGVGQRTPKDSRWYLNSPQAKTGSGHHVQLLTFDDEQLAYRVVLLGGEVFDEHHLTVRPTEERNVAASE